jgi:hypothetical protein
MADMKTMQVAQTECSINYKQDGLAKAGTKSWKHYQGKPVLNGFTLVYFQNKNP